MLTMIRGKKAGAAEQIDPWRQLAAGVVHQALVDAGGRELRNYRAMERTARQEQAQRWLLSNTAAEFMRLLDLSHESVLEALTSPTPVKRPQRGRRHDDEHAIRP